MKKIILYSTILFTILFSTSCEEPAYKLRWHRYNLECKDVYGRTVNRTFDLPADSKFYTTINGNRYTLDCISHGSPFNNNSNFASLAYDIIDVKIISIDSSSNFIHASNY